MAEKNKTEEFRLKNMESIKKCFIKEIYQNELMSKKHKKVSIILKYTEHFLTLVFAITECVSICAFASLVGIPKGITSSD